MLKQIKNLSLLIMVICLAFGSCKKKSDTTPVTQKCVIDTATYGDTGAIKAVFTPSPSFKVISLNLGIRFSIFIPSARTNILPGIYSFDYNGDDITAVNYSDRNGTKTAIYKIIRAKGNVLSMMYTYGLNSSRQMVQTRTTIYNLDGNGRLISDTTYLLDNGTKQFICTNIYTYDSEGSLTQSIVDYSTYSITTTYTYDDKINPLQGVPIVGYDASVNNPHNLTKIATISTGPYSLTQYLHYEYDDKGYPVKCYYDGKTQSSGTVSLNLSYKCSN